MRSALVMSLTVAVALLAGCATEGRDSAGPETVNGRGGDGPNVSARDLTLRRPVTPPVAVVSKIELTKPVPEARQRTPRPKVPRPAPVPATSPPPAPPPEPQLEPIEPLTTPKTISGSSPDQPASEADAVSGAGRELAPGRTVTVIPASSGPSVAAEEGDEPWAARPARGIWVGGGGGDCRGRGGLRGAGSTGRIPLGIPRRRLQ